MACAPGCHPGPPPTNDLGPPDDSGTGHTDAAHSDGAPPRDGATPRDGAMGGDGAMAPADGSIGERDMSSGGRDGGPPTDGAAPTDGGQPTGSIVGYFLGTSILRNGQTTWSTIGVHFVTDEFALAIGPAGEFYKVSNPPTGSNFDFVGDSATTLFDASGQPMSIRFNRDETYSCNHHSWSYNGTLGGPHYYGVTVLDATHIQLELRADYEFYSWVDNLTPTIDPSQATFMKLVRVDEATWYASIHRDTVDSDNTGLPPNVGCLDEDYGL
jgi:hypothetical protein